MTDAEKEIFIDEMSDMGDEWTLDQLKGTEYETMSLECALSERKSAVTKFNSIMGGTVL